MSNENTEHQIDLKNPFVAAVLGYLIPGAGHFYQGRYFKGALFLICIAGMFCYGMRMAEGKAVYFKQANNVDQGFKNFGFLAQAGVGTPALAAIVQWKRFQANSNVKQQELSTPLNQPFSGKLILNSGQNNQEVKGLVTGRVSLQPDPHQRRLAIGTFQGTIDGKKEITLNIAGRIALQRSISGSSSRVFSCTVAESELNDDEQGMLELSGAIPRPLYNSFAAPVEADDLRDVRRRLGNKYDLAVIFTWIAGLLNVLAVWDAFGGPAYGYDDQVFHGDDKPEESKQAAFESSKPAMTPESMTSAETALPIKKNN